MSPTSRRLGEGRAECGAERLRVGRWDSGVTLRGSKGLSFDPRGPIGRIEIGMQQGHQVRYRRLYRGAGKGYCVCHPEREWRAMDRDFALRAGA